MFFTAASRHSWSLKKITNLWLMLIMLHFRLNDVLVVVKITLDSYVFEMLGYD